VDPIGDLTPIFGGNYSETLDNSLCAEFTGVYRALRWLYRALKPIIPLLKTGFSVNILY
jgi:hypothetical protein